MSLLGSLFWILSARDQGIGLRLQPLLSRGHWHASFSFVLLIAELKPSATKGHLLFPVTWASPNDSLFLQANRKESSESL